MSVPLPKTDVVIVGLGAAGGTAAYVLAEAGLKVVGLEAGPRMDEEDFLAKLDELGTYEYRNWMGESKVNHENPTWRPDEDTPAGPVSGIRMMNAVGGTSIHWGAQSWRLREDDFLVRSTTVERYGEEALPEGSAIEDWGITYDELEPYYDKAEYMIGVAGKGGANPFESPRSRDYPMPPSQPFEMGEVFEKAMSGLGYHPFPIPAGFTTVEYNGRPACSYCGMCSGYGCWNNSKTSAHVTVIPAAEATGNLEVHPNSRVLRVLTDAGGNATGVEYLDEHGTLKVQPASVVIVATYTYENTRLLLTSANEDFPNGLANNSGQVGKYFMTHSIAGANGFFPGQRYAPWAGTSGQGVAMDDLNGDNFDHAGLGFIRGGFVSIASGGSGPISLSRNLPPGVSRWGAEYKRWLSENTGTIAGVTMLFDVMPYEHNSLDLDPKKVDRNGVPVIRITYRFGENEEKASEYFTKKMEEIVEAAGAEQVWSFGAAPYPLFSHAYGGTRMGTDPAKSVVDKYGRTHEVPNLFVLGASTHASSSGYNPTETVFAHSWFAAEYLAENFSEIGV